MSDDDDDDLVMSDLKDAPAAEQGEDVDKEMLDAPAAVEGGASVKTRGKEPASDPGRDRGDDGKLFMVAVESTFYYCLARVGGSNADN